MGAITLAPFQFAVPTTLHPYWILFDERWVGDLLLNIALFLPFGFIVRRTPGGAGGSVLRVLLAGALLSALIEGAQLFLAPRYTAVSDLVANAFGAGAGAILSDVVTRRLGEGRTLVGRLLLDLPLMGFVYLLIPLVWLGGLATGGSPDRLWAVVPLVSAGVLAIAAVAESGAVLVSEQDGHAHLFSAGFGLAVLFWYLLGAVPALGVAPLAVGVGAMLVVVLALVARLLWHGAVRHDRRLEPQVVRLLLPLVLLYLAALTRNGADLHVGITGELARVTILRWLERGIGFTLLGYLVAEWRGRREELLPRTVFAPVVVAAVFFAALAHFAQGPSDIPSLGVALGATAFGALLYAFQRAHILALLGRAEAPGP